MNLSILNFLLSLDQTPEFWGRHDFLDNAGNEGDSL